MVGRLLDVTRQSDRLVEQIARVNTSERTPGLDVVFIHQILEPLIIERDVIRDAGALEDRAKHGSIGVARLDLVLDSA